MLERSLGRIPMLVTISATFAIILSTSFALQINQDAWAGTFPGPNGQIAFVMLVDDNSDIYVMNADGSEPTRLTSNEAEDSSPSWSPDGTKIAFSSNRDDGNWEIYVMNADGSEPTRLTSNEAEDSSPSWSPDGTKIAFASRSNDYWDIYVMNADGSEPTRLTDNLDLINDLSPSWSPDGTKIAFTREHTEFRDIYVMNADGSEPTRLTDNDQSFDPSWSPDGTKIAFVNGVYMYVMNADGSEPTRLSRLTDPEAKNAPDWGTNTSAPGGGTGDTTPPVLTVPVDITEEATSPDGAQVSFEVTAEDEVDGPTDVDCDHNSGETFPIGETIVICSAEDLAGNRADEKSFTITVQDTTAPDVEITDASDRRNGR